MKLAFSTLGCPDWGWDDILATAKDMGFQGIEIRGVGNELYAPNVSAFASERMEASKNSLSQKQLEIICLTSACYLDDKTRAEAIMQEARDYIDLAEKLGVPYVRVLGDREPFPGTEVDDSFVADRLIQLAAYARPKHVSLLIESNGVYADSARLAALMEKVQDDNVGVLWDIHHPYRYFAETPAQTYENIGQYVRYLHVKDSVCDEDGKLQYRMMGRGDVPVAEALKLLQEKGYQGYVSLEWVKRWYADLEAPGVAFMQFVHFMEKLQ